MSFMRKATELPCDAGVAWIEATALALQKKVGKGGVIALDVHPAPGEQVAAECLSKIWRLRDCALDQLQLGEPVDGDSRRPSTLRLLGEPVGLLPVGRGA